MGFTRAKSFVCDDVVIDEVNMLLWVQNVNWYKKAISAVVSYWCKTVATDGDSVKKNEVIQRSTYSMNMFKEL